MVQYSYPRMPGTPVRRLHADREPGRHHGSRPQHAEIGRARSPRKTRAGPDFSCATSASPRRRPASTNTTSARSSQRFCRNSPTASTSRSCLTPARRWSPTPASGSLPPPSSRASGSFPFLAPAPSWPRWRPRATLPTSSSSQDSRHLGRKTENSGSQRLAEEPRTVVFFETPHRIQQALAEMAEYIG